MKTLSMPKPAEPSNAFGDSHDQLLTVGDRKPTTFSQLQGGDDYVEQRVRIVGSGFLISPGPRNYPRSGFTIPIILDGKRLNGT